MRACTPTVAIGIFFLATAGTVHAAPVTLYSQLDASGEMVSEQATFQNTFIESASLGNLFLGKGRLYLTFTIQDPNANSAFLQPGGVALESCLGCQDLQTYYFTNVDRTLLSDGAFHTLTVLTGTTTLGVADGTTPIYIRFFGLSQYHNSTHLKSNAAGTIPYLLIEADAFPPVPVIPQAPLGSVTLYTQSDGAGVMTNTQVTFQNAYIDSASLGNLSLGQGSLYLTFAMKDPNASNIYGTPMGVCLQPANTTACNSPLQTYHFTNADRTLLADRAFHTFLVETGTTTSTYADGTRPVSIGFFGLSQYQFGTKVKSNVAATIPTLTIQAVPTTPPAPKVSNVLFLPGMQASRLYMKNGIGQERQLWEPSIWTDIPELAMNADGTSVNTIYTKDIVTDLYDNTLLGGKIKSALGDRTEVYASFVRFMDGLVASTTLGMREWRAYPYDWRYDPRDVVEDGTLTKFADGTSKQVFLDDVLDQLATTSATGKVTIVAHSNGGLVAKALLIKLEEEGRADLVDQLIMVGTPQWGTPVAVGSMLHADDWNLGAGFITYAPEVRATAATMPDLYALLPSKRYFERIAEPVATFKNQGMSAPFYQAFPSGIASFAYLYEFVTNALGLNVLVKDRSPLNIPLALSPGLLADAEATHDILDNWTPPSGLKVSAIAGWGQLTVYSYEYSEYVGHKFCFNVFQGFRCKAEPSFLHTPRLTEDGDGTVVSPSAVGDVANTLYFDSKEFERDTNKKILHRAMTSSVDIQDSILSIIKNKEIVGSYIKTKKPVAAKGPLTIISAYSPVNVLVTNAAGEETGIIPLPEIEGIYFASQDIPGSAVVTSGEEKFVYLPAGSAYSITATGYASGPATIEISQIDALGETTATTAIADIPVTASTTISLSVDAVGAPSATVIDFDDDDVTDITITSTMGTTTSFAAVVDPLDYVAYMRRVTAGMALNKPIANELRAKLATIERTLEGRDLDKKGSRKSVEKILDTLITHITKHTVVPAKRNAQSGISLTDAAHILDMIGVLRSLTLHL